MEIFLIALICIILIGTLVIASSLSSEKEKNSSVLDTPEQDWLQEAETQRQSNEQHYERIYQNGVDAVKRLEAAFADIKTRANLNCCELTVNLNEDSMDGIYSALQNKEGVYVGDAEIERVAYIIVEIDSRNDLIFKCVFTENGTSSDIKKNFKSFDEVKKYLGQLYSKSFFHKRCSSDDEYNDDY